jgi:hypothetical protein
VSFSLFLQKEKRNKDETMKEECEGLIWKETFFTGRGNTVCNPSSRRLRQKDGEFKASVDCIVRP